jgi:CRISPR/Cas system-associated exonuclease Cas4 (RecB family)
LLSKSRFLSGKQCELKLFYDIFRRELRPEISSQRQRLYHAGHQVGRLAHDLFPGGVDASPAEPNQLGQGIMNTQTLLAQGVNTIYEAAFSFEGVYSAIDILHCNNGVWHAIEVKSSSSVKGYYLIDAALQYWVMKRAGIQLEKFFILHVNTAYIKRTPFSVSDFFVQVDITSEVLRRQESIEMDIQRFKEMIASEQEPQKQIGRHCNEPFVCDYQHYCWRHIPEKSVFDLYNARGKDWKFYEKGIYALADIPSDEGLTHWQRLQVQGARDAFTYCDVDSIRNFLNGFRFPLYFFDFETIAPVIPILEGTRPVQQLPFQYSLHVVHEDLTITHREFLAQPEFFGDSQYPDPRLSLLQQLVGEIGEEGSIVAYNAAFEKMVLGELAEAFPQFSDRIHEWKKRFVDLLQVFSKGWFYTSEMGGSASIKQVLPAVAPAFSYKDLPVSNGGDASHLFLRMVLGESREEIPSIRENLLRYCERDTEGMVVIWKFLREQIQN